MGEYEYMLLQKTIEWQTTRIKDLYELIKPCACADREIGMCIPCAMRDRVAAGESVRDVVEDYEIQR